MRTIGFVCLGLCDDRLGEAFVDGAVRAPVGLAEYRSREGDMAQRPKTFVGEAIVVPVLLGFGYPDAPQRVFGSAGRHGDAIVRVDRLLVGTATAVCDPGSAARPHNRLQCGDEAAGGDLQIDAIGTPIVDVGFAVCGDDHLHTRQLGFHDVADRLLVPIRLLGGNDGPAHLQLAERLPDFTVEHAEIGGRVGCAVARHGTHRLTERMQPLAQNEKYQRHGERAADEDDPAEQQGKVIARFHAAPFGKRQIVQDDQMAACGSARDRKRGDQHVAAGIGERGVVGLLRACDLFTRQCGRNVGAGDFRRTISFAECHGGNARVRGQAIEELADARTLAFCEHF